MNNKVFFKNFSHVITFGVFGTILQFGLFASGLFFINKFGIFSKTGVGD